MELEVILGIVGLALTIFFATYPSLRKKLRERPRLEVEIQYRGGTSLNRGLSPKNDVSNGPIDANEALRVFELEWRMVMIIRNHSDVAAYYTRLIYCDDSERFTRLDKIKKKPILNTDEVVLNGAYSTWEVCKGRDRTQLGNSPPSFNNFEILLEYQNHHGTKFYTHYQFGTDGGTNALLKKKPKNLNFENAVN